MYGWGDCVSCKFLAVRHDNLSIGKNLKMTNNEISRDEI